MPTIQCVSAHCCPRHSNYSTYTFHMLWSLLGSVSPTSVRGKGGLSSVSHSHTTAEHSVSHPGHEQAQWFRPLTKLLDAKLDADLSSVLEDAFFSNPLHNSPDIGFSLATYNTQVFFDCQIIINLRLRTSWRLKSQLHNKWVCAN